MGRWSFIKLVSQHCLYLFQWCGYSIIRFSGFPAGSDSWVCLWWGRPKFDPWVGKIPGEGNGYPVQLFLPGKSQGWRSLAGYNPWGHKKLDTNERLIFSLSLQDSISLKYLFGEGENNLLLSSNWYYQFLTLSLIASIHLFILSAGKFWRSLISQIPFKALKISTFKIHSLSSTFRELLLS